MEIKNEKKMITFEALFLYNILCIHRKCILKNKNVKEDLRAATRLVTVSKNDNCSITKTNAKHS